MYPVVLKIILVTSGFDLINKNQTILRLSFTVFGPSYLSTSFADRFRTGKDRFSLVDPVYLMFVYFLLNVFPKVLSLQKNEMFCEQILRSGTDPDTTYPQN